MAKLTLNNVSSGYNSTSAINTNNDLIEAALENTLSLDGTTPNSMGANFDMNGYAILNQLATSGDANFSWLGEWATPTAYSVNNLVFVTTGESATYGGGTWICTTDHTAGAGFDADVANWSKMAQQGDDGSPGAGTGDVVGPGSSVDNRIALFDSTTGKLIKESSYTAGDAAAKTVGLSAGNLPEAENVVQIAANNTVTGNNTFSGVTTNSGTVGWAKGSDVASENALFTTSSFPTDGNYFDITGTTSITSLITSGQVGTVVKVHFDGALTLTHHATDLILPSEANITTVAGDEAEFIEYNSGDWRCTNYTKLDGTAIATSGGKVLQVVSNAIITNTGPASGAWSNYMTKDITITPGSTVVAIAQVGVEATSARIRHRLTRAGSQLHIAQHLLHL